MIVIEDDDWALRLQPIHQVLRCQHVSASIEAANGPGVGTPYAVVPPSRARGEHDTGRAKFQHLIGGYTARTVDVDVLHLVQLIQPIVSNPCPSGESRQTRFASHAAAQLLTGFGQVHRVAAPTQEASALQSGGTRADDEKRIIAGAGRNDFRMPAL